MSDKIKKQHAEFIEETKRPDITEEDYRNLLDDKPCDCDLNKDEIIVLAKHQCK